MSGSLYTLYSLGGCVCVCFPDAVLQWTSEHVLVCANCTWSLFSVGSLVSRFFNLSSTFTTKSLLMLSGCPADVLVVA